MRSLLIAITCLGLAGCGSAGHSTSTATSSSPSASNTIAPAKVVAAPAPRITVAQLCSPVIPEQRKICPVGSARYLQRAWARLKRITRELCLVSESRGADMPLVPVVDNIGDDFKVQFETARRWYNLGATAHVRMGLPAKAPSFAQMKHIAC